MILAGISLSESDKRLLIILLIIALLFFLLLGCLGMLLRKITSMMSKRMDYEIHDAVVYRVIQTPEQLKKYGIKKNNALFFKQSTPAFLILLVSLIIYIIYGFVTNIWGRDYWGEFGTLFYEFDWGNPDNYANFFGLTLLSKFPELKSSPTWVNEFWPSYVLMPLWIASLIVYLLACQGYLARAYLLNKRSHSVFEKNLDDFNFFDDIKANSTAPLPPNDSEKK